MVVGNPLLVAGRRRDRRRIGPISGPNVLPSVNDEPPKAHPPGAGASCPQSGEGGCPFEPGRVRDGLTLRVRWSSASFLIRCCGPIGCHT